jgi:hypothetical protein
MQAGFLKISVLEHDGTSFPSELHQHGLQVLARRFSDDAADSSASGKVYLLDMRVSYKAVDGVGRVLGGVEDEVQATIW